MLGDAKGYGYRGPDIAPRDRDPLMSGYNGMPIGVVRSSFELFERLNGRKVDYHRAPLDEDKQAQLRRHLMAQIAKDRMQ